MTAFTLKCSIAGNDGFQKEFPFPREIVATGSTIVSTGPFFGSNNTDPFPLWFV